MPSVTMKASIPIRVIRSPFSDSLQPRSDGMRPAHHADEDHPPGRCSSDGIPEAVHHHDHDAGDEGQSSSPTERSSPPAVITKVMPTAMIPMKAERESTLVMFFDAKEIGVEQVAHHDQHDEREDRPERLQVELDPGCLAFRPGHSWSCQPLPLPFFSSPIARRTITSSFTSSPVTSPAILPAAHHADPVAEPDHFRHLRGDHDHRMTRPRRAGG